ncbi:MAG: SpoIIE family protein phosphatase [Desulfotalea sp.]
MLKVVHGHAEGYDTKVIVEQVINDCTRQLDGKNPSVAIVFAGPHLDHELMLTFINKSFPGIKLIGCSTAGNFSTFHGGGDDAITLTLLSSNQIHFAVGVGNALSQGGLKAIDQAISTATSSLPGKPKLCFTFPDGYGTPIEPVLEYLNNDLGPNCPVFGGVAGTLLSDPNEVVQFYNQEVLKDSLPILLFSGPVEFRSSIANSWSPIGKRAVVNSSTNRRVYKIGGLSAVQYYRKYLGYHEEPPQEFTLAVYENSIQNYYHRAPIIYHDDESITFTGNITEGSKVQLTDTTRGDIIQDTRQTNKALSEQESSWQPALAIVFSCAFRKNILGTAVDKELEALRESFPPALPVIGFFSLGEIAPLTEGGPPILQAASLTTLLIGPGSKEITHAQHHKQEPKEPCDPTNPKQYQYLKRKLMRSEADRKSLESVKEFTTKMHHQMMDEVEKARQKIQRKEKQLQESEEKFRRIVQTAGQGFVLMDESMTIIDTNSAFRRLIHVSPEAIIGRTIFDFLPINERTLFSSNTKKMEGYSYRQFEGTLLDANGKKRPVLINSNLLRNDTDELIGHMAFFADITEQKKALVLAGEVQKSLLPQHAPTVNGLDIAGRNVSCDEVGGDYYDFFLQQEQSNTTFSVAVGDISGHGVDAALLMSSSRAFLRLHASQQESLTEMIDAMNMHLVNDVRESGRFMTLFYLSIHSDLKSLEWVRAGHDPAILFSPSTGTFEELKGAGMALGFVTDYKCVSNVKEGLQPGDILALGTDGIWETVNIKGEMFGKERFKSLLENNHNLPATGILDIVFQELELFRDGQKADDDVTLVIIKIKKP